MNKGGTSFEHVQSLFKTSSSFVLNDALPALLFRIAVVIDGNCALYYTQIRACPVHKYNATPCNWPVLHLHRRTYSAHSVHTNRSSTAHGRRPTPGFPHPTK